MGMRRRGVCLLILALVLQVLLIDSAISIRVPLWTFLLVGLMGNIILPIWAARDAFINTRAWNTGSFEKERTAGKDPWLAVFLSVLLPGAGHLYLRRLFIGAFVILVSASLCVASRTRWPASEEKVRWLAFVTASLLPVLVLAHAYVAGLPCHRRYKGWWLALVLLLATYCVTDLLRPLVIGHFFVRGGAVTGLSMVPTIGKRGSVIVDRFTYCWRDPAIGEVVIPFAEVLLRLCHCGKTHVAKGGEIVRC
jgi:hypothetical protein